MTLNIMFSVPLERYALILGFGVGLNHPSCLAGPSDLEVAPFLRLELIHLKGETKKSTY